MSPSRPRPTVHAATLLALCAVSMVASCASPTAESDLQTARVLPPPSPTAPVPAFALPALALHDRSGNISLGGFTDAQLDTIAMMPMAVFQLHTLFNPGGSARVRELKQRNPDIVVLGVLDVLTTPLHWDTELTRSVNPMAGELFDLLRDRWFETLEGDPALMWENARMVDPMRNGTYDRELVRRFADVVCRYAQEYDGVIDGVFYDYMSTSPWMYPNGPQSGTLDLDGDGVPSHQDDDEKAAWAGFQIELLREMQDRFGEGFIQVANGDLGLRNAEAARALAGVCLEKFPTLVWAVLPQEGIRRAMNLEEPGYLTPRRGRTWNVLSFGTLGESTARIMIRRLTSALTGALYVEARGREGFFPGLDDVQMPELGAPLGPVQLRESEDEVEFTRRFEHLTLRLVFDGAGRVQDASLAPPPD
jgi:hypothetical protein